MDKLFEGVVLDDESKDNKKWSLFCIRLYQFLILLFITIKIITIIIKNK